MDVELVDSYVQGGLVFTARNGGKLKVEHFKTLKIDPRGHFTSLRCAIIVMLDNLMERLGIWKPFAEFCEFFANYPNW